MHYNASFYLKGKDKRGFWKQIGQGFPNDKGQITVKLYALPLSVLSSQELQLRLFPVGGSNKDEADSDK